MKKKHLVFLGLTFLIVLFGAGMVMAAPQQGVLVDENGDPVEGFSNVWIESGVAYPVYNTATHLWYSVFIVGTGENGVVLCALGEPLGTRGDFRGDRDLGSHEGDDNLMPDSDVTQ